MNWRDITERAAWTAVQAGVASVPVSQVAAAISGGEIDALAQVGLAALGAASAALISFVKTLAQERLGVLVTRHDMIEDGH